MSEAIAISAPMNQASQPAPRLRIARFEDYQQIARVELAHNFQVQPESDWRSLWLDNPLWPHVKHDWPMGWVLENTEGCIVGSVVNVPSLYTFRGNELISANGRAWVVDPEYRGFALWLMDEYFNQSGTDLFINTTVGPKAVESLSVFSARIPLGNWETVAYCPTGYRGFAQHAMKTLGIPGAGVLAFGVGTAIRLVDAMRFRSLREPPAGIEIAESERFDGRFDAFWKELVRQNPDKLLAARDSAALSWHFAIPMRRKCLRILTASRDGVLRAYCILKRQDPTHEQGIRRMRLVDYQSVDPQEDLLSPLVARALQLCAQEKIDLLEHQGTGLPKMRAFDAYAPYRRKLKSWPFYYHAADPALDTELRRPERWDPSAYDGDTSFE